MRKKNPDDTTSKLTLLLEAEFVTQLDRIKILSGEATSAGAIRYALKTLPVEIEKVDQLTSDLEVMRKEMDEQKEKIVKITEAYINSIEKKQTP